MAKGVKGSTPPKEERPIRTSFNIYPEKTRKLKYIGLVEGKDMTVLINEALDHVIEKWEKKNGEIKI
ncbi:MAG: hypothetical protein EOP48_14560 [Sphingobacteriales bacterium]|nr:MAG: hypothetical protein EOP48_14560 [Sphingobacteriales bacterium]